MRSRPDLNKLEAERQVTVAPTVENYMASLEHGGPDEETVSVITFSIGPRDCAFEVSDAVEVLRPRPITEVPRTPGYIKGILSVRGEMITVIDLRARVGMTLCEGGAASRILIVTVDDIKAGFLVDRLGGVKSVKAASVEAPGADAGVAARFLKGVIASPEGGTLLLEAAALIWPDEQP